MRILVADDLLRVRQAIRLVLETLPEARIVAEVGEAAELEARLEAARADFLLLDWELPGMPALGGAEAFLRRARRRSPGTRLVVLSVHPESGQLALAAGADAFVSKTEPPERLIEMLSHLAREGPAPVDLSLPGSARDGA